METIAINVCALVGKSATIVYCYHAHCYTCVFFLTICSPLNLFSIPA